MFQYVLIVYFLLDWLNFWAEVHLVQEEIDLSQKGLLQNRTFKIFGLIDSLFPPGLDELLG